MKYLLITLMAGLMAQGTPDSFIHSSSQVQAFYYFVTVTIDSATVASDDWVGAFNGDVCVGARKWDTSECGEGICEVPAMGDDGQDYSNGYLNFGDIPTFKIFDASENIYYDATSSVSIPAYPQQNNQQYIIDDLQSTGTGSCDGYGGVVDCAGECGGSAVEDCAGDCGGSAVVDECGVCGGDGIANGACDCDGNVNLGCGCGEAAAEENYDCDSNCIVEIDCAGDCGGSAVEDECGVCGGGGIANGECDCDGNTLDECDVCGGDNSSCAGCDGVPNSGTEFDCAGVCDGNCDGCDECGVCGGDGSSCAAPTWRLQLVAEVDSWDQFANTGNPEWLLRDDQNFLGAAVGGSWGYDENHDILEPAPNPGNYISLFFDHPEWDTFWGSHFTEDIVHDNDNFFSTNLTQWNGTVVTNVPGTTSLTLFVETGDSILQASTYEMY
ncbi:MAG: hypothetical protein QF380_06345, partial [Candidatus Marinimicrobia bacterium]|nr:hypothetical protein [Candidatus Neomarinimicrobiota bacterium]